MLAQIVYILVGIVVALLVAGASSKGADPDSYHGPDPDDPIHGLAGVATGALWPVAAILVAVVALLWGVVYITQTGGVWLIEQIESFITQ